MGRFKPGISGNPNGRPKGSKQRLPDREQLCELLDRITADLVNNYDSLTMNQRIRILSHFGSLYNDSALTDLQEALAELSKGSVITFDFTSDNEETWVN